MNRPRTSFVSFVCCAFASSGLVLGCYLTASPGPPPGPAPAEVQDEDVVYVEPPPRVETYPVVVYAGTPHYYVDGRWYVRRSRGWGYYRREPAHLSHQRPQPQQRHDEHHEGGH